MLDKHIERLIELASTAGEGASDLLVLYFILDFGKYVMFLLIVLLIIYVITRTVRMGVESDNSAKIFCKEYQQKYGVVDKYSGNSYEINQLRGHLQDQPID